MTDDKGGNAISTSSLFFNVITGPIYSIVIALGKVMRDLSRAMR